MFSGAVAVIGLGYVGRGLAWCLADSGFRVTGYDHDDARIAALGEESPPDTLTLTASPADMRGCGVFIIAAPTPLDSSRRPDLSPLLLAVRRVGRVLAPGALVIVESTVAPGTTEDILAPTLEEESGLRSGVDFRLGFAPERVCPGDPEHQVDTLVKVISGTCPATLEQMAMLYGAINGGRIVRAPSIRTAECAKILENVQRDFNIALMNEFARLAPGLGVSLHAVLEVARSKWNFLPFTPGLVGGHCIGVDTCYLLQALAEQGQDAPLIRLARETNESFPAYLADRLIAQLPADARVVVCGLSYKENVADLRNSKAAALVHLLQQRTRWRIEVWDPVVAPEEAAALYGLAVATDRPSPPCHAVVLAVAHDAFRDSDIAGLVADDGVILDIRNLWPELENRCAGWQTL